MDEFASYFPDVPDSAFVDDMEELESDGSIGEDLELLEFIEQVVAADLADGGILFEIAMEALERENAPGDQ